MSVLSTVSYVIPMEILKPAVLQASQRVDWVEMIIQVLAVSPAEKLCELGADVSIACRLFIEMLLPGQYPLIKTWVVRTAQW